MTLDEMETAGRKAESIKLAIGELRKAEEKLALLNSVKNKKKDRWRDRSWFPTLILKEGDAYGWGKITVDVEIPFGVVQQQLVYAVENARREVISLGGLP